MGYIYKTGVIVIDVDNGKPQAVDEPSGGYPYDALNIGSVHFFRTMEFADKYISRKWSKTLKPVKATLSLTYEE